MALRNVTNTPGGGIGELGNREGGGEVVRGGVEGEEGGSEDGSCDSSGEETEGEGTEEVIIEHVRNTHVYKYKLRRELTIVGEITQAPKNCF